MHKRWTAILLTAALACGTATRAYCQSLAASVPVGSFALGEDIDQQRGLLYVVNQTSNSVSVISLTNRTVVKTVSVSASPAAVAVAASGLAYVAASNAVSIINPTNNYSVSSVAGVKNPSSIVYNPVNKKIYVAAQPNKYPDNKILIIDPSNNNAQSFVYSNNGLVNAMAVDPNSGRVYAVSTPSCYMCNSVMTVIDPQTNNTTSVTMGSANLSVAVDATSGKVYVPNQASNTLSIVDPANGYAVTTIPVGNQPTGVAIDANHVVYVSNLGSNSLTIVNPATNNSTSTLAVSKAPGMLAYDSGTNKLTVSNGSNTNNVSIVALSTLTVTPISGVNGANDIVIANGMRGESYITAQGSVVYVLSD